MARTAILFFYLSFCEHDLVKRELLKIFYFLWFHLRNLIQQFQMRFVHDRMPDQKYRIIGALNPLVLSHSEQAKMYSLRI